MSTKKITAEQNGDEMWIKEKNCQGVLIVKFIHSENATKFCKISTLLLSFVMPVKSKVEISQNFVAFSEYMCQIEY